MKAVEGSIHWESMPGHPDGSELEAALTLARAKAQGAGPLHTTPRRARASAYLKRRTRRLRHFDSAAELDRRRMKSVAS